MGADPRTLAFYDGEAAVYAGYAAGEAETDRLARFAARLPAGAAVLDFGCGSGWAAAALARQGFAVSALDASAGLAAEARARYGLEVRVAPFEALDDVGQYDAIWASFCLLHDAREAMPGHLARLHRALRPAGLLYLGLKEGTGAERDRLGRRYTYYTRPEIEALLRAAGFPAPQTEVAAGEGYDGSRTGLLHTLARRGQ